jgi:hypothetical protein
VTVQIGMGATWRSDKANARWLSLCAEWCRGWHRSWILLNKLSLVCPMVAGTWLASMVEPATLQGSFRAWHLLCIVG